CALPISPLDRAAPRERRKMKTSAVSPASVPPVPAVRPSPLLEIALTAGRRRLRVFAKAEWVHRSGSIKDRLAAYVVHRARREGLLRPGAEIVEASSGNTAIAFASLGAALGHPVTIFMPDWMSRERTVLLEAYGARVVAVSREE